MEIKYYYKNKGGIKYLEAITVDNKIYRITKKEFVDLKLVKKFETEFVYDVVKLPKGVVQDISLTNCSKELKQWVFDSFMQQEIPFDKPINDGYRIDIIEEQNKPKDNVLEEKIEHLAKIVKGLNRDLLRQYCNEAFNAGYQQGYQQANSRFNGLDFNAWFNAKMSQNN